MQIGKFSKWIWVGLLVFSALPVLPAESPFIDFSSDRWTITDGRVADFLGRKAFIGSATLKDVEFENGVIEFDIAASTDRARSYPGVVFRSQPGGNWERFYIRPHRSTLYGDVVQYVAAFNGVDSWQFYSGPGATARGVIPVNQWLHVKVEVSGSQARLFLGDAPQPALVVPRLKHGQSKGQLGVMGPADGTAYFSNFTFSPDNNLIFRPPPPEDEVPGIIRDWQVSKPFAGERVDSEKAPDEQGLGDLGWTPLKSELSGLVDLSRLYGRSGGAEVVFAKTVIQTDRGGLRKFDIGYSDIVTVFINGQPVFSGASPYQGRDSSFLGIAGWFDSVFLPMQKGPNELMLAVTEYSGGWGFMVRDSNAVWAAEGVTKIWETPKALAIPESVAFDRTRGCLYVSSFDPGNPSAAEGLQAIAKLDLNGHIVNPRLVTGLFNPTGLTVAGNRLYAVERGGVAEIDLETAQIITRYPLPTPRMPNDIAAAPDGALFVSDSYRATIYKIAGGKAESWLQDPRLAQINGIVVDGSKLIVVTSSDGFLKSIDLGTKEIQPLAAVGPGILDGLEALGGGQYLVSHNEGRLFRVTAEGRVTKILDTSVPGRSIADFTFAQGKVFIPTFTDGRVVAFQILPAGK